MRHGVVISFVSNFTDNFSRTHTAGPAVAPPAAGLAPGVSLAGAVPAPPVGAPPTPPAGAALGEVLRQEATLALSYAPPTGDRASMAEVLSQRLREAGASVELVHPVPVGAAGQRAAELRVSYRLDEPRINEVSALLDAAVLMPGSKLQEAAGDLLARRQAANRADERPAPAQEQRRGEEPPRVATAVPPRGPQSGPPAGPPVLPVVQVPAYEFYIPSTETGIVEARKASSVASPQLNVATTSSGEFGLNPHVDQQRLLGDGLSTLDKFFAYALPTSGHKIAHVKLVEPGRLAKTERGWEVVTKGKLAVIDSQGNVFMSQVSEKPAVVFAPAAPVAALAPARVTPPGLGPAAGTRFSLSEVPGELLARLGVPLAELERTGQLQRLLAGQKTDLITGFQLPAATGELPGTFAAKLVLDRDAQGVASLRVDLPRRELEIPRQLLGKDLTPAMQQQLKATGLLPLAEGFLDSKGQAFAAYLAVDPEMKRVVAVRPGTIALPPEVYGVKLSLEQQRSLLAGHPARVEGMTQPGAKQVVDAVVQLDPLARKLVFRDTRPRVAPERALSQREEPARQQALRS